MKKAVPTLVVLACACLLVAFQNCNKVNATSIENEPSGNALGNPGAPTSTEETLKTIQPTLAVRAMSCVLCHAQIKANVITDFGFGTSEFMGGDKHFDKDQSWYNNLAGAWQSSHISGSIYVPAAQVSRQAQNALGEAYLNQPLLRLKDFMNVPYQTAYRDYLTDVEAHSEMTVNTVPDAGGAKVIEKSNITIRAPSVSEIQSLAPALWSANAPVAGARRIGSNDSLQLIQAGPSGHQFMQNDENAVLECSKSDIVVRGTLLLRRLKVHAAGGCRLYVSGSVFIEEGISYVGSGELQNLQITSSSSVIMGINSAHLKNRLIEERRGLNIFSRDYLTLANQVIDEAQNIGNLKDAVDDYKPRASYDYTGLLLNAPIIHSRYLGKVQGTIIADAILFALGEFHFEFDPVVTKVNVLPLLTNSILTTK